MTLNDIQVVEKNGAFNAASPTKIKVVGCGGCGGNAVDTMIATGVGGVEFIALNTDLQALTKSKAAYKIQIGQKLAGGLGAGGKPEVGEESAKEQQEQIKEILKDSDMVFITAGMGGGTGTGSAPVVAKIARELGALTVAVVTTPFKFEGKVRMSRAEEGVKKLRAEVDSLIAIPNELILKDAEKGLSIEKAFIIINDVLRQGVQGISDIITKPGLVNRDFRDVQSVMKDQGDAILGIGVGSGTNRATDAAHNAINNRLLVDTNIDGAKNVLINIAGNHDVGIAECDEIASIITERANPDAVVLWGQVLDESMEDKISVTVIATGFDSANPSPAVVEAPVVAPKTNSDTISADDFVAITSVKKERPVAEKKDEFFSKLGFGDVYEDDGKSRFSSPKTAQPNVQTASASASDNGFSFTQPVKQKPVLEAPADFDFDSGDINKPACWRKLNNLSPTIEL